jgi:hypothetical protein
MNCLRVRRVGGNQIKLLGSETVLGAASAEISELPGELSDNVWVHGLLDAMQDLNITSIEADLPRVWRRDDDIASDELAALHVIAKCG